MTTIAWQRLEGLLIFGCAVAALWWTGLPFPVWAIVLLVLAPDLSFLAYLAGPRIGAAVYNPCHTYGLAAVLTVVGVLLAAPIATALGLLWIAHVGADRAIGYGLKEETGFKHTHLGRL
ncbi:MAG: DUF4260 domain-containing protein [Shimia sp.]